MKISRSHVLLVFRAIGKIPVGSIKNNDLAQNIARIKVKLRPIIEATDFVSMGHQERQNAIIAKYAADLPSETPVFTPKNRKLCDEEVKAIGHYEYMIGEEEVDIARIPLSTMYAGIKELDPNLADELSPILDVDQ